MKEEQLKYSVIGAVIGGLVVWFLFQSAVNSNNVGMMRMMGIRSGNQGMMASSNAIDAHFIEQMIPHHEDAITMAKLAREKASRDDVKQLAQNIIDSQSKEIEQMKKWYQEWFGQELPTGEEVMNEHGMMGGGRMHMGMMGTDEDIARFENATDFDRAFVEEMIPHHQMAVMMANMLKNSTTRPEMKDLAEDIITAQTSEIDQMRTWLREWEV